MATIHAISPSVQQPVPPKPKPIHFSAHDVALMAYWANEMSADFVRVLHPYMTQTFFGIYLEMLAAAEPAASDIPLPVQRYFNVKPNRTGGFTWIPQ